MTGRSRPAPRSPRPMHPPVPQAVVEDLVRVGVLLAEAGQARLQFARGQQLQGADEPGAHRRLPVAHRAGHGLGLGHLVHLPQAQRPHPGLEQVGMGEAGLVERDDGGEPPGQQAVAEVVGGEGPRRHHPAGLRHPGGLGQHLLPAAVVQRDVEVDQVGHAVAQRQAPAVADHRGHSAGRAPPGPWPGSGPPPRPALPWPRRPRRGRPGPRPHRPPPTRRPGRPTPPSGPPGPGRPRSPGGGRSRRPGARSRRQPWRTARSVSRK